MLGVVSFKMCWIGMIWKSKILEGWIFYKFYLFLWIMVIGFLGRWGIWEIVKWCGKKKSFGILIEILKNCFEIEICN